MKPSFSWSYAVLGLLLAAHSLRADSSNVPEPTSYAHRLAVARAAYYRGLLDADASVAARAQFDQLHRERPADPVVNAYTGSLDLLNAGRTWAVWSKHSLTTQGLAELDSAVASDPENLEARFIRAATTWHLPFFLHRRQQAESDLVFLAPRVEEGVRRGLLPRQLGAAALDYYGQLLEERRDANGAKSAFSLATRIAGDSSGGQEADLPLRDN